MSRDESLYLADIQDACKKVLKFTAGMTYKDFIHDDLHFDAVIRNLEIIGESTAKTFSTTKGTKAHKGNSKPF